jgi:hypothetical protein
MEKLRPLVLLLLFLCSPARAEGVEGVARTQRALEALRFDEAQRLAQEALAQGGQEPDSVAKLYFLWGQAAAAVERKELAEAMFGRSLEIAPGTLFGGEMAPKFEQPFRNARTLMAGRRLELKLTAGTLSDGRVRVSVTAENDVYGLVQDIEITPQGLAPLRAPGPIAELAWPCVRPPCAYTAALLDANHRLVGREPERPASRGD